MLKSNNRVAIHEKELAVELRGRVLQRAAGTAWMRLGHHGDGRSTPALALIAGDHLRGLMAGQQQHALNGRIARQFVQQVIQKRSAGDLEQWLRQPSRRLTQPGSSPPTRITACVSTAPPFVTQGYFG